MHDSTLSSIFHFSGTTATTISTLQAGNSFNDITIGLLVVIAILLIVIVLMFLRMRKRNSVKTKDEEDCEEEVTVVDKVDSGEEDSGSYHF